LSYGFLVWLPLLLPLLFWAIGYDHLEFCALVFLQRWWKYAHGTFLEAYVCLMCQVVFVEQIVPYLSRHLLKK
jgi:hypothetical protein